MYTVIKITIILILVTASITKAAEESDQHFLNNLTDLIIKKIVKILPKQYSIPRISISNFHELLRLETFDGTLRDMSTVKRKGDVSMVMNQEITTIKVNVTFNLLSLHYDKFLFKIFGITSVGTLTVKSLDNLFQVWIRTDEKSQCLITIEDVRVLKLSSYDVETKSTCNLCSKLKKEVFSSIIEYFKLNITNLVNDRLKSTMKKMFEHNEYICI